MRKLFFSKLKTNKNPSVLEKANRAFASFNFLEKVLFSFFALILVLGAIFSLYKINGLITVSVPQEGGRITEGVIGTPRFINPLFATSDADRDLSLLIYSGLMKATTGGKLITDLAESLNISDDGLTYVFKIKDDVYFHNGNPVTADDVLFTVKLAQNNTLRSPRRANWEGVLAEKISDKEISFRLSQPFSPFLENTTIGILPKSLWEDFDIEQIQFSDLNINPVGSGPYRISSFSKDSSGIPTNYKLVSFDKYALGKPYINEMEFKFYRNENELLEAYKKGAVLNINSISPEKTYDVVKRDTEIITPALPRVFGVFFNQNEASIFTNKELRVALDVATDKKRIVDEVLEGFGTPINGPIPPGATDKFYQFGTAEKKASDNESPKKKIERAIDILERNGWELNSEGIRVKETKDEDFVLDFSISTSNSKELKEVGEILKENWEQLGAKVELEIFDIGTLNQEVIRPRAYQSLLFGEIVGRDLDLFAFWHSSQRNDPGLNIALYTNITVDNVLEKIRKTFDSRESGELFEEFKNEIDNDVPAVFLYSPDFIYLVSDKIKGLKVGTITTPAERFLNVTEWYINTDRVWSFLEN